MENELTSFIKDICLIRSLTFDKYENGVSMLQDKEDFSLTEMFNHHSSKTKWYLYKIKESIWERVIIDCVICRQRPIYFYDSGFII